MSQPEVEFEFDPPEFLSDKAKSLQAPKKLKYFEAHDRCRSFGSSVYRSRFIILRGCNERHSHAGSSQKKRSPLLERIATKRLPTREFF